MLHAIDANGNIQWHCPTSTCEYHNCEGWDREINCSVHERRVQGKTHTAHISDPAIRWCGPNHINLPACPICASQWGINIYDEIAAPIIKRDEITGKILQYRMPEGFKEHGGFWIVDANIIRKLQPHPTLAHLSPAQIEEYRARLKTMAPDAPLDWMMTETIVEDIHRIYPHPAIARHQELKRQLIAIGKVSPYGNGTT